MPVWETLSDDAKRLYARYMEVYAGFVSFTDHHFGRVVEFLREIGELDNTLIMVISDNGASSEGSPVGSLNEMFFFNNVQESLEANLKMIDELGGVETCNHYPWGWANAGNTPFRRWKRETYRGGTTDPCIVSWPKGIQARGELRTQYGHCIDLVPTVLEALGIEAPAAIRGVTQAPIDGISFAHTFNDAAAPSNHHTQYFEMFAHRAIYHDGWRAVCPWPGTSFTEAAKKGRKFGSPITNDVLLDIETHDWELYNVDEDSRRDQEPRGRAPRQADRAHRPMVGGGRQVPGPAHRRQRARAPQRGAPDDRPAEEQVRVLPGRLGCSVHRRAQGLQPSVEHHGRRRRSRRAAPRACCWPRAAAPAATCSSSRTRSCSSSTTGWAARGSGSPPRRRFPEGEVELRYEFEPTGKPDVAKGLGVPARAQLYINRKLVGAVDMPYSVLNMFGTQGLYVRLRRRRARCARRSTPGRFPFTGTIKRVTLDLSGELIQDAEADMKIAMARQ